MSLHLQELREQSPGRRMDEQLGGQGESVHPQ